MVLMVATAANWWLGRASGLSMIDATIPNILIIAVSLFKAFLVGRYFMEVVDAPRWLRRTMEIYVVWAFIILSAVVLAMA
ncbi:cytochrome C oxidase subunit IV family protein [Mycobacterium sp. D16R24]|uniref:cytochrome C oxidase subunit IV family protein n=1 Tax=Mycobacterium sp. D16R24 TaxID=1855656 RepID=UPI001590E2E4|nr:cytochrome C oxidase subunit IV family protein [Mycobacterium sp. D16R24]